MIRGIRSTSTRAVRRGSSSVGTASDPTSPGRPACAVRRECDQPPSNALTRAASLCKLAHPARRCGRSAPRPAMRWHPHDETQILLGDPFRRVRSSWVSAPTAHRAYRCDCPSNNGHPSPTMRLPLRRRPCGLMLIARHIGAGELPRCTVGSGLTPLMVPTPARSSIRQTLNAAGQSATPTAIYPWLV